MLSVSTTDVDRMTKSVFIDGPLRGRPSSRFWILLVLAGVIASAGLVGDSVATVIGAMIVAPLMTPILGLALGLVLADRHHVVRSAAFVVLGALAVIAIGYLVSVLFAPPDDYATNAQIAARISPRLIDLVAALATGLVGAFALVRSDVADTLPGVAIAISLVPPLAVVGMLLQVGRLNDAAHALLLFGTNVTAIIATGTAVLLFYNVRRTAIHAGHAVAHLSRKTIAIVVLAVVVVALPLAAGSASVLRDRRLAVAAGPLVRDWATQAHWLVSDVAARNGTLLVTAVGSPPEPDPSLLRASLNEAGFADADLAIVAVDGTGQLCPAGEQTCSSGVVSVR